MTVKGEKWTFNHLYMFLLSQLPSDYKSDCYNDVDESEYACKEKKRIMVRLPSSEGCPNLLTSYLFLAYTRFLVICGFCLFAFLLICCLIVVIYLFVCSWLSIFLWFFFFMNRLLFLHFYIVSVLCVLCLCWMCCLCFVSLTRVRLLCVGRSLR